MNRLLLFLAIITPCIPKIQIAEGITVYPYEIFAVLCSPWILKYIKFKIQKTLLLLWVVILISTIISCLFVFASGGLMRCVKEMIYIPLMYMAYQSRSLTLRMMTIVFVFAFFANISYLVLNGFFGGFLDIWDPEMLSSGLSNKMFSLSTFSIGVIPTAGGAHGIWLGYNSLAVCLTYIAWKNKEVSLTMLLIVFLMGIINVLFSVSREGLIGFCFLMIGIVVDGISKYHSRFKVLLSVFIFIGLIIYIILAYGDELAIVQKVLYTHEAIETSGSESNISLRVGAWYVYCLSVITYPIYLMIGYGFNLDWYELVIDQVVGEYSGPYVAIPESFFVETAMYGGILAFVLGILFWRALFAISNKLQYNNVHIPFFWLLFGFLIGNIFSGATIICDLLYSQLLISCGLLLRNESFGKQLISTYCRRSKNSN